MKTITMPLDDYNKELDQLKSDSYNEGYNEGYNKAWERAAINLINGLHGELTSHQDWAFPKNSDQCDKMREIIFKLRSTR